jgi:hypothetical protein
MEEKLRFGDQSPENPKETITRRDAIKRIAMCAASVGVMMPFVMLTPEEASAKKRGRRGRHYGYRSRDYGYYRYGYNYYSHDYGYFSPGYYR